MKKLLVLSLFAAASAVSFGAWSTVSYNLNDIYITGATFTNTTNRMLFTWQGYIANNRNSSTYRIKVYDQSMAGALVYSSTFSAYSSATNYSQYINVFPGHVYSANLYAVTNQAVGTTPPSTHITNWCWIYANQ